MTLAAIIGLVLSMAIDDIGADGLRASNGVLRDQTTLLQNEIASLQSRAATFESAEVALTGRLEAAQGALSGLCSTLKSAADSGQFSPSGQVEAACGPVFPLVAVVRPRPGDSVPMATEVSGTADVRRLNGLTIWFAVTTPGVTGFFLQGDWPTESGPANVTPEGRWTSPGIFVGQRNETGKPFDIVIILADNNAAKGFWGYLRRGYDTGKFPAITQLPAGAQEYLRLSIVRE